MDPIVVGFGLFCLMVVEGASNQLGVLLHHVLTLKIGVCDVASPVCHFVADLLSSVELLNVDQIEGV